MMARRFSHVVIFAVCMVTLFSLSIYIALPQSNANPVGVAIVWPLRPEVSVRRPPMLDLINRQKYAVIIRSHAGYMKHLMALLWAIDAQSVKDSVYVIIAPTEFGSIEPIEQLLQEEWTDRPHVNVRVLKLEKQQYDEHCCLLESICTPLWRKGKLMRNWSTDALDTYCGVNSPLHYFVTDSALNKVRQDCIFCEFLLVTNADNYYSPDFLSKASQHLISTRADVVLTDIVHHGHALESRVEVGHLDLGCVLTRFNIFLGPDKLNFTAMLPHDAEPQDWHDADFWMVYHLQTLYNRRIVFLRETLFVHN